MRRKQANPGIVATDTPTLTAVSLPYALDCAKVSVFDRASGQSYWNLLFRAELITHAHDLLLL